MLLQTPVNECCHWYTKKNGPSPIYTIFWTTRALHFCCRKISQETQYSDLWTEVSRSKIPSLSVFVYLGTIAMLVFWMKAAGPWEKSIKCTIDLNICTIQVVYYRFLHQQPQRDAKRHEWMEFWERRHQQWKEHPPTVMTSYGHCGPSSGLDHLMLFLQMRPGRNI